MSHPDERLTIDPVTQKAFYELLNAAIVYARTKTEVGCVAPLLKAAVDYEETLSGGAKQMVIRTAAKLRGGA